MDGHYEWCGCAVCVLQRLDEGTPWELSGDMLSVNDEDDGMATVPSNLEPAPEGDDEGIAAAPDISSILSCASDMAERGDVEEIIVILNMVGDDQIVFTSLERNDLIVGTLETAKMNWFNTQLELQYSEDDEGELDGIGY